MRDIAAGWSAWNASLDKRGAEIFWNCLNAIKKAGGRPFLVGGQVRDLLRGKGAKDVDVEVFGLSVAELELVLARFGQVDLVGKAFGVLKLHGMGEVDFSVPRRDNKVGVGHKGFEVECDPSMTTMDAARRRDLTINSMSLDPFTLELVDPFNGMRDLEAGLLRATDSETFLEDPLRALRVAQFVSRFNFRADDSLVELCKRADLSQLPGERVFTEFEKLLVKGQHPRRGMQFLADADLVRFFPELDALRNCEQDKEWHAEGTVWNHTLLCLDAARQLTDSSVVMWAVLCHDLGKPSTTLFEDGHLRSRGHEEAGEEPTRSFLGRVKVSRELMEAVVALVVSHLAPTHFFKTNAGPAGFRRLARKLALAGTDMLSLEAVARADHFGRDAANVDSPRMVDWFHSEAARLQVSVKDEDDVVKGRHLLARGFQPGPFVGEVLRKCREFQFETGEKDPDKILDSVLK